MMRFSLRHVLAVSALSALAVPIVSPAFGGGTLTYMPASRDADLQSYADGSAASSAAPYVPGYGPGETPPLTRDALIALLRQKIRYVFVIFNENHSFDNEFGTFPGANGLYSDGLAPRGPEKTPGFVQTYTDAAGARHEVRPFRLGPEENSTIVDSVDHSHEGLAAKLAVQDGTPTMSGFAAQEYKKSKAGTSHYSAETDAAGRQYANLVMSYIDCDTIPFMWRWANRFVLFDNIFATEDTPSTPNAIAMIAGQAGETQWVKHADADGKSVGATALMAGDFTKTRKGEDYDHPEGQFGTTQSVPILEDPNPYWGSQFEIGRRSGEPVSPGESYGTTRPAGTKNVAPNLTFATVPLTAAGKNVVELMHGDRHPETDLADIWRDIHDIAKRSQHEALPWRWYENGYDREPTDTNPETSHKNYVAHHDGPQYFGYIANNPDEVYHLKGENDFFEEIAAGRLPKRGVFYIRGGFHNIQKLEVPIQNPNYPGPLTDEEIKTLKKNKSGDDDHPAYSDRQISEAMAARVIDAVAANQEIWDHSAIVITYDESDGFYDHVPPRILSYGPDNLDHPGTLPLSRGIRVPLILISPYARSHVVAHAEGDHNAVISTLNAIFDLPPLSSLPEESDALKAGNAPKFNKFGPPGFEQKYLGPRDTPSETTDDLLSAFDVDRLEGRKPPLPASLAQIDMSIVNKLPHYEGRGCERIGIVPEDKRQSIVAPAPAHFNPLPSTLKDHNAPAP